MNRTKGSAYLAIVPVVVLGLCTGCGSSPSSGGGPAPGSIRDRSIRDRKPKLTTNVIRTFQPGDSWTFEIKENGILDGVPFSSVGECAETILDETVADLAGSTARVRASNCDVARNDGVAWSYAVRTYFSQDAGGTLYQHGWTDTTVDPPVDRFVQTPAEGRARSSPSPVVVGDVNMMHIVLDDGTTFDDTMTVVAIERITLPAGTFVAAKYEGSSQETTDQRTTSIEYATWIVPALGVHLREEYDLVYTDQASGTNTTTHFVSELTDTNVLMVDRPTTGSGDRPGPTPPLPAPLPPNMCGNAIVEPPEQCDPPSATSCDAFCRFTTVVDGGNNSDSLPGRQTPCGDECDVCFVGTPFEGQCLLEFLDNGICECGCQFVDTDCDSISQLPSVCGNGIVESGEQCDPPDASNCGSFCQSRLGSQPLRNGFYTGVWQQDQLGPPVSSQ